jgi:hypothetical protein
MGGQINRAIAF